MSRRARVRGPFGCREGLMGWLILAFSAGALIGGAVTLILMWRD